MYSMSVCCLQHYFYAVPAPMDMRHSSLINLYSKMKLVKILVQEISSSSLKLANNTLFLVFHNYKIYLIDLEFLILKQ